MTPEPNSTIGQTIAIANQKGGVGKTTTAVNLSACMAAAGRRVLLIDMDPQGNATSGMGLDKQELGASTYEVLMGEAAAEEAIRPSGIRHMDILPANRNLVGAAVELVEAENREGRLRDALNLLTVNSLVAARGVVVTLQCEYYALEGLSELLQTISRVREGMNPHLELEGVLLTMYQHTRLSNQVIADVREHMGDKVYQTIIPRNITLAEAPSFGQPVIFYDLKSAGARAYLALAREVVSRG